MEQEKPHCPDSSLSESDNSVMGLIEEEGFAGFTFDGLKRRLGLHPETLSRSLSRLEDKDLIRKRWDGYRVTAKAQKLLGSRQLSATEQVVPVLQTLLPPDLQIKQIVSSLAGKWFGTLRWLGYANSSENTTLKWVTEDGGIQVDAIFSDGSLSIEAKMLSEKSLSLALRSAYQLIGYISKLFSRSAWAQHVAFTYDGRDPDLEWM